MEKRPHLAVMAVRRMVNFFTQGLLKARRKGRYAGVKVSSAIRKNKTGQ